MNLHGLDIVFGKTIDRDGIEKCRCVKLCKKKKNYDKNGMYFYHKFNGCLLCAVYLQRCIKIDAIRHIVHIAEMLDNSIVYWMCLEFLCWIDVSFISLFFAIVFVSIACWAHFHTLSVRHAVGIVKHLIMISYLLINKLCIFFVNVFIMNYPFFC